MNNRLIAIVFACLLLAACGGGSSDNETDTGGGSSGTSGTDASTPTTTTDDSPSVPFNVAGTWTDTDLVGSNSCGLALPAPGSSRVTPGIVIEQTGDQVTLTSPPNILGTRTVATGQMQSDGNMVLTGNDGGSTITLNFRATSDNTITGTSQVVAGGCTYNFSNSLLRTG
jgi:hypothetical protein